MRYDLAVVGGGPAGTAAAITAARAGRRVLLLERGRFPRHKVCGEFISPEATGLLRALLGEAGPALLDAAPRIGAARLFLDGRVLHAPVEPAALSVPRFELDAALWRAAEAAGAECRSEVVVESVEQGWVACAGETRFEAPQVVYASGRWSNLARAPLAPDTPRFLGLKAHFREAAPPASTDLYFFEGGYCGVQPVGADAVNVCAMVHADVAATLEQALARSRALWWRSRDWTPITEPVATSPLVFRAPRPVEDGVMNVGDAAGFIDPFAGDGIAIALRSGARAASATPAEYAAWYAREIAPAFHAAARFRALMGAPRWLRAAALALLGSRRVAAWAVRVTRSRS